MLAPSPLSLLAFLSLFAALSAALFPRGERLALGACGISLLLGLWAEQLSPAAVALSLPALIMAWLCRNRAAGRLQAALLFLCGAWALAAALHLVPGFSPHLWSEHFGRSGAQALRWHYDKGLAGLILMLALPVPARIPLQRWMWLLPVGLMLPALCLASGLVSADPRLLPGCGAWLAGNLFLTVFAEEAFFRGLIQGGLQRAAGARLPFAGALGISAVTFGLVHLPWGATFAAMAVLAGLLYGVMAGREGLLAPAIATHALTNAGFLLLTNSPLA